ncbi:MAG: hypothetical protein HC828_04480 [Blastochloris sp.]|nr:hypothetical protein [Blastochloris sp.]
MQPNSALYTDAAGAALTWARSWPQTAARSCPGNGRVIVLLGNVIPQPARRASAVCWSRCRIGLVPIHNAASGAGKGGRWVPLTRTRTP